MIFDRRQATRLLLSLGAASGLAGRGWATETTDGLTRAHGHTLVGDLKYPPGFAHYDYVKTDAPKGGTARLASIGAFDSFNPFIVKGNAAGGFNIFGGLIYDTIMTPPLDQSSTEYGLIAEWMEWPSDFSHVDFKFREEAAWHDGRAITVADAVNTLNLLRDKGRPFYRLYYKNVSAAKDMGGGVLRFEFDEKNNRELPQIMGQLPVLPSHYWESRNFDESSLEIPLGSGPYRIGRFEANRFTEYERVPDYWGADLPVNIGTSNFDILRLEYFKDGNAGFEAFKAGNVDYRNENSSLLWATAYDFPALERGDVVKEELELNDPKQVQGLGFNLRRPQFADRRTRKAIGLAFDFEWTNTAIYYGQYARPASYFQGTPDLMPEGIPEGAELAFLEPFRDQLPPELFTEPFAYPVSDGSGRPDRRRLREAKKLLEEAGWQVDNGKLVDADGKPFELEFLIAQKVSERVIAPFVKNLERLGIDARIRLIDAAQYVRRLDEFDFDMVTNGVANSPSPGNEQREFWGSEAADQPGSRNTNGVKNPAIDALIDKIIYAKDRDELAAASRAMDRILLWENYNILSVYAPFERIAYWKERVARPEKVPDISIGFPTTWYAPGGGK